MVNLAPCHTDNKVIKPGESGGKKLTIALAGNSNVGKSVIFNRLTGSHQIIGNWPGKTVERAEGRLEIEGYDARIVDLPGIYSLSTFSLEEVVTREYIAHQKPDVIINVIGAPVLERNLFFTLQLMELNVPMVVCLNQMDVAGKQGISIDAKKLEAALGLAVIPTVGATGKGIRELIETAVKTAENKCELKEYEFKFKDGVEAQTTELTNLILAQKLTFDYPARWMAIKLLEGDSNVREMVGLKAGEIVTASETMAKQIEAAHHEPPFTLIASERYALAHEIALEAQTNEQMKPSFSDKLDYIATHKVYGYLMSFAVIAGLLLWTFTVGNFFSGLLTHLFGFFQRVDPQVSGPLWSILWNGVFGGLVAGVTLVIPFVVPFYLMLALLEDSGILTRVAFMLDSGMHQMGLHGKAIIPIILGYGCNVPAIYTTRIMGTKRERMLAAFAITFSPCAARTIIILGLVGVFIGIPWALALYVIDLLLMFVVVKLAVKVAPGELTGLIMEMHSFKTPSLSVISKQTWARTKGLVYMVFPMYMIGTAVVQGAYALGVLQPINQLLSPITVFWLGLPLIGGILLIFGAARKELILLTAVAIFGKDLTVVFTPAQLMVLALVGVIYPCFATIGVLTKEFGWKPAWAIIGANLGVALIVGGIAARVFGWIL